MLLPVLSAILATLPAFSLAGLDGQDATRAQLAGKPAVVQFWASWCVSCGGLGDELAEVLRTAGPDVPLLAVSVDEDLKAAKAGTSRLAATRVPHRSFYFDRDHALATALGGVAVPTVLVVDGAGRIVARVTGHFGAAQRGELAAALRQAQARP